MATSEVTAGQQLFVRHAKRDGRSIAVLRAVDHGDTCVVEAQVYPAGSGATTVQPGFANATEATAFVTEAVEALMYLGCDITAD
jgi:hypothetical protein